MKRVCYLFFTLIALLMSLRAHASVALPISGRVVDDSGEAICYATVVLSLQEEQITGGATDDQGRFELYVDAGEYELTISYVGYQQESRIVESGVDLGEFTLKAESTKIDNVVVTSNFIRREADRFIVDVANAPSSIGQDGEELLRSSPGVWVMNDEISINGNSNPKIYVNDRELKLSNEQTMIYLRNLKSDDVRRIEVIPQSGAELDASSSSGVIMIYLKRQMSAGMIGNISLRGALNSDLQNYSPSASINFQTEKLSLNTSAWYNGYSSNSATAITTNYTELDTQLSDISDSERCSFSGGGRLEAVYNFNSRHSVGAEVNYFKSGSRSLSGSESARAIGGIESLSSSSYDTENDGGNLSVTFNYIYKLDSLGSTLKLLADYNNNSGNSFSDNIVVGVGKVDSLHQSRSFSDFKVATVTLAAEKVIAPKLTLKSGAKYTNNDMDSRSNYSYFGDGEWQELAAYNKDELYTEEIGAAYLIGSSHLGRWSMVAGLRAEYTKTKGRDNLLNKDYMSWFPNFNLSYLLDPTGSNSITAQYSRSISRPNFWSLNPARTQSAEYLYIIGNPSLLPEYKNSVNLTFVYKYKYSLTASMQIAENSITQIMMQDQDNPNVTYISSENIK